MLTLLHLLHLLGPRLPDPASEGGFSTAELLANAALAVGAIALIWTAMGGMGENVVNWIGNQLMSGGGTP